MEKERRGFTMITRIVVFAMVGLLWSMPAAAQLEKAIQGFGLGGRGGLSDTKISSGLKEALKIGTENTVNMTGKEDGYFKNQAIKILMPEKLRGLEKGLRAVGYGPQVDEFILSMNRAAEKAAPSARQIFWDALAAMTFEDAKKILSGNETAATEYFRAKTSDKIAAAFRPFVDKATNEVGVTRQYKDLVGRYQALPLAKSETLDVDHYVVNKAVDGLFFVLGGEERKIRTNPSARVTDLLREVFGK
jgi:hypothetical protein